MTKKPHYWNKAIKVLSKKDYEYSKQVLRIIPNQILNSVDKLLAKLFPSIFCMGRRIVLKKAN